jgi:hypothetical protein
MNGAAYLCHHDPIIRGQSRFAGSARRRFAPASHYHFFHTKTFTSHGGCRQMDSKGRRHPMEIDPKLNGKMPPFL